MAYEVGYRDPSGTATVAMPIGVDGNSYLYYSELPAAYRMRPPKSNKTKHKPGSSSSKRSEASINRASPQGPPVPVKGLDVFYASDIGRTRALVRDTNVLQNSDNWRQFLNVQELVIEDEDGNLRVLPEDLVHLRHLQAISIRWSRLKVLPPSFGGLPITHANLSHNRLQSLNGIENLTNIVFLDVSCNALTSLPDNIGHLRSLRQLRANGNKLRILPDSVGNLPQLVELSVSSNRLKCLPETLCQLASLKCLDFAMNPVTNLPVRMDGMKGLVQLVASCNRLVALPASLQYCLKLRHIFLRQNCLKDLPEFLGNLPSVESINAQCNEISEVKFSNNSLKSLLLDGNSLGAVPSSILACRFLTNLSLSANRLTTIPPEIRHLSLMRRLNVGQNELQVLPKEMFDLRELRHLLIYQNEITTLPIEFLQLTKLAILCMDGNEALDGMYGALYRQGGVAAVREVVRNGHRDASSATMTLNSKISQPSQTNDNRVASANTLDGKSEKPYMMNGNHRPDVYSTQTLDRPSGLLNHNETRSRPNSLIGEIKITRDRDRPGSKKGLTGSSSPFS